MLFTSPAFMFLFLPFSVIFCLIFGKNRKKLCLATICMVYYILLNMNEPINMIWLPLLLMYAYFSARAVEASHSKAVPLLAGAVPVVWLISMRCLDYYEVEGFTYPVGITLPALCAAAYVWDVAYGERAERNIARLGLYLFFFPIMLIGPFVGYFEFCRLTDGDNMQITRARCSSGIKLFATGFIKRIAVGAVLMNGYEKIFAYSWDAPNISIIFFLMILIYFGVFFSVSGYYDMASGISRMYGIDIPEIKANPFKIATVNEYSNILFGNLRVWADRYIVSPIEKFKGSEVSGFLRICVVCICAVAVVCSDISVFLLTVPLIAFSTASAALRLDKKEKNGHVGVRILFGVLTVFVIGAFWVFITMAKNSELLEYIEDITVGNAEYQTDMVLISFSGVKYLFVAVLGCILLLPNTDWANRLCEHMGKRMRAITDYSSLIFLLLAFAFTAVFFLPSFEIYSSTPFSYITI